MTLLTLKSSNKYKINEFTRLLGDSNIKVEEGSDLKEVLGTIDEVIVYKALEGGQNVLVEDTTMIINNKEEVEIKWKYDDLKTGDKVTWIISLGVLRNDQVEVYRGFLDVVIDRALGKFDVDGVAFEPFLVPLRANPKRMSYTELTKVIDKDIVDPRAMAVKHLLSNQPVFVKQVKDIDPWTKEYQND